MKHSPAFLLLLGFLTPLMGSISITFTAVDNLQDINQQTTDGMDVAIVVDTGGNGFDLGNYTAFDYSTNGLFLPNGSGVTDDWLVYSSDGITQTVTSPPVTSGGSARGITNVPFSNLTSNDDFGLIWFNSNSANAGDAYGFITDGSWLIPADGNTGSADGSGLTPAHAQYTVAVPEPTTVGFFLGLFALAGIFWKRQK